ncbi:hypothetical protein JHK82_027992 [Glycine max]|nr:hypothetical protein JHK82_027992 [Glycine max]
MVVVGYDGNPLIIPLMLQIFAVLRYHGNPLLISPHHCIDLLSRNLKIDQCPYSTLCSSSKMCLPHLQLVSLLE